VARVINTDGRPTYPQGDGQSLEVWVVESQRSTEWSRQARATAARRARRESIGLLVLMVFVLALFAFAAYGVVRLIEALL
jgi:hypothetical protein